MHLVAGIDAVPGVRAVLCLHEGVAAGAADGYFRLARKPAAVLLHLGPGLANAGAQLHNAHRARSPVLALVGDLASWHARDAPLRTDIAAIAASLTSGWVRTCADGARLASDAVDALEAMAGVGRGARESRVASLVVSHDASWARVPRSLADASSAAAAAMRSAHGAAEAAPNSAALVASGGSGGSGSGGHAASLGTAFSFFTFFNDAAAALRRHGPASAILLGGSALVGASLAIAAAISAQTGCALLCENNFARLDRGAGVAAVQRVPYFPRDAEAFLRPFKVRTTPSFFVCSAVCPTGAGAHRSAAAGGDVRVRRLRGDARRRVLPLRRRHLGRRHIRRPRLPGRPRRRAAAPSVAAPGRRPGRAAQLSRRRIAAPHRLRRVNAGPRRGAHARPAVLRGGVAAACERDHRGRVADQRWDLLGPIGGRAPLHPPRPHRRRHRQRPPAGAGRRRCRAVAPRHPHPRRAREKN